jgi:hypothetical protein
MISRGYKNWLMQSQGRVEEHTQDRELLEG